MLGYVAVTLQTVELHNHIYNRTYKCTILSYLFCLKVAYDGADCGKNFLNEWHCFP